MTLRPGTRLGAYEVAAAIGRGGMGEVYRARDTRLNRDVALKVLPDLFASDPDRLARFRREAQVLASLNHPNIAAIYGLEEGPAEAGPHVRALVLELVEGPTLADRISHGPVPVDEALPVALQIAAALEAAHEAGIVHRDLKPANIKVRPDGAVKILDFGLAKALDPSPAAVGAGDPANSPTITSPARLRQGFGEAGTVHGVILGTAAYMSPEQARGRSVDKRTDIWAFGCVLYEMLTRRPAFPGDTVTDVLAAILTRPPDWAALPPATPPALRRLLRRCLEKDPRRRLHDAADLRIDVDDLIAAPDAVEESPPFGLSRSRWTLPALMLLAGIALASALWWIVDRAAVEDQTVMRLSVSVAQSRPERSFDYAQRQTKGIAISRDGRWIAYALDQDGVSRLFLRGIHEAEARAIDGTEGAGLPFFSPDGRWIGFGTTTSGRVILKKVPVTGGSPTTLASFSGDRLEGAAWEDDNTIVYVPSFNEGIWAVPAEGGQPRQLLGIDPARDRIIYLWPQPLPGGKGLLFTMASGRTATIDDADIAVLEAGATEPRVLVPGGSNARYVPSGHLVYLRAGALLAVPFDPVRLVTTGTPTRVVDGIDMGSTVGDAAYAIADNGTLVYFPGTSFGPLNTLVMFDRHGGARAITETPPGHSQFSISADGRRIAEVRPATNDDLWIWDLVQGTPLRLTSESGDELSPAWTPDGTRIAYGTKIGRKILWRPADGTGQPEELSQGEYRRFPTSFSPDGNVLVFDEIHPSQQSDIWLLMLDDKRTVRPLLTTDADERAARFSPDGRAIAYVSNESGRDEVYVMPYGAPGGRKQVSTEGGTSPAWAKNRPRELFFLNGARVFSRTLDAQGSPVGPPRLILDAPQFENFQFTTDRPYFDVMPDGDRFVVLVSPRFPPPTHFNVVINWFDELRRLVAPR